jgi:hypothetical protein
VASIGTHERLGLTSAYRLVGRGVCAALGRRRATELAPAVGTLDPSFTQKFSWQNTRSNLRWSRRPTRLMLTMSAVARRARLSASVRRIKRKDDHDERQHD